MGAEDSAVRDVSATGASRLAESTAGHEASEKPSSRPGGVQKKIPEIVGAVCLKNRKRLPAWLMFQDEGQLAGWHKAQELKIPPWRLFS